MVGQGVKPIYSEQSKNTTNFLERGFTEVTPTIRCETFLFQGCLARVISCIFYWYLYCTNYKPYNPLISLDIYIPPQAPKIADLAAQTPEPWPSARFWYVFPRARGRATRVRDARARRLRRRHARRRRARTQGIAGFSYVARVADCTVQSIWPRAAGLLIAPCNQTATHRARKSPPALRPGGGV